jgi:nuclear GTP-binding protein
MILTVLGFTIQAQWILYLSPMSPTPAFHASMSHSFGEGFLIQCLRRFTQIKSKSLLGSLAILMLGGTPSSIAGKRFALSVLFLERLRYDLSPKLLLSCPVSDYITLGVVVRSRDISRPLPGIVRTFAHDFETDTVLKGVMRLKNLSIPPNTCLLC